MIKKASDSKIAGLFLIYQQHIFATKITKKIAIIWSKIFLPKNKLGTHCTLQSFLSLQKKDKKGFSFPLGLLNSFIEIKFKANFHLYKL
jgi:hypothetical protein